MRSFPQTGRDEGDGVVATGIGVLSPIGKGIEEFWAGLMEGRGGISMQPAPGGGRFRAGAVPDFRLRDYLGERHRPGTMGRAAQLAVAAGAMALADSGVDLDRLDPARVAVILGTTFGEPGPLELMVRRQATSGRGPERRLVARAPGCMLSGWVAACLGVRGCVQVIATACAAGSHAIGYASALLRRKEIDAVLAGGVDALSHSAHVGFSRISAVAPDLCRPFDRNRRGLIVSEGAAVVLLEREELARARGARVYGEILGFGQGADAHHMTNPHPQGRGGARAIRMALERSGVDPGRVDYISAHGTGTRANDLVETLIVKQVFGERAQSIPISSIKSMIGHSMGAASALNAVTSLLAIERGMIPPTTNYETPDPQCDLDYVPNRSRPLRPRVVLSNAFGFGGNVGVLLLGRHAGNGRGEPCLGR